MSNIDIRPNFRPSIQADRKPTAKDVKKAQDLLAHLSTAPLSSSPVVAVDSVGLGGGEWMEAYEFVVVRRFRMDGDLIVGGANGEVFNVSAFATRMKNLSELL